MRFKITALGSAGGRTVGRVVGDIVRYLQPREPDRPPPGVAPPVPSGDGPSSYYADRGTEPGRWLGHGALETGLTGPVDSTDFARVLSGRDPATGERLITASGSAGRRPTLGAGQETRWSVDGQRLYGIDDIAATLKITRRESEALVVAGQRRVIRDLGSFVTGTTAEVSEPGGSYLVPVIDDDGNSWVTGAELDRCTDARDLGTDPEHVAAIGEPYDQLTVIEAARLAGVTAQYMRSVCKYWEDHSDRISQQVADGEAVRHAYLVAHRGTRRQWLITRRELVAFLERRIAPAVRVGFDLTLTTEKSLGVLALLGSSDTRKAVLDAIENGNDAGLHYLEYHATGARSKGKPVLARGLTIASFRHLTSRALDPFPHHHNVVANTVVDEHGTRRALDARGLYQHARAASAIATIAMRHQLTQSLGVTWRRGHSGHWEIDGIPDEVLREFSQRRNEIEEAVAELEAEIGRRSSLDEVQAVITGTRPDKEDVDPSTLVEGWWERAMERGYTPRDLQSCVGRCIDLPVLDEDEIFSQLASPEDGVCAGHSLFTRSDVLTALADLDHQGQPLLIDTDAAQRVADAFLASDLVIQLDTSGEKGALAKDELFTTTEILQTQRRIVDHYAKGLDSAFAVVGADTIDDVLDRHPDLIGEQQALVRSFCCSGHRVQCAIGRAGAGKTTTMRAAAQAWQADGFHVIGAAVKGEAARQLAVGADIPSETVAWYLARADNPPLHEHTVLIVDEASMLSDRDLDALLHIANGTGATVRLIGDPDQHGAVAAGGMFRYLCQQHPEHTPELATTHRVQDANDQNAARLLRDGRSHEALAALAKAEHLHIADNEVDLYLGMLRSWWDAHQTGQPHPMVDRRHHTRRVLNRLARQLRRANGELGSEEVVSTGGRAFAAGDRIVARMPNRDLSVDDDPTAYVRNGATGTVVQVDPGTAGKGVGITVDFDGIGPIRLPRGFLDEHDGPGGRRDVGIDHAYAVTSYAVQGATFDLSTSRIDQAATRSETYVDITRGRQANHLFLARSPSALDSEHLPKAPDPALDQTVAERLRRSGPERAAIELPVLDTSAATARLQAYDPPRSWTTRHPALIDAPVHLRRRQDEALRALLAYRIRWQPRPGANGPWEWALGAPPDDRSAGAGRDRSSAALDRYAHTLANEVLTQVDLDDPTFIENLRYAIGAGIAVERLPDLVQMCIEIEERRRVLAVDGPTPVSRILDRVIDAPLAPPISPPIRPTQPRLDRSFP